MLRAILSMVIIAMATAAYAWNEPEDFRSAKWGSSPEETRNANICVNGPSELLGTAVKSKDPRIRFFSCGEFIKIGAVSVSTLFIFLDNKLSGVDLSFNPKDFAMIGGAFQERYGEPTKAKDSQMKNRMGATFNQRELLWLGSNVSIRLKRYAGRVTSSNADFSTNELLRYFREKKVDDAKDAAKDL